MCAGEEFFRQAAFFTEPLVKGRVAEDHVKARFNPGPAIRRDHFAVNIVCGKIMTTGSDGGGAVVGGGDMEWPVLRGHQG